MKRRYLSFIAAALLFSSCVSLCKYNDIMTCNNRCQEELISMQQELSQIKDEKNDIVHKYQELQNSINGPELDSGQNNEEVNRESNPNTYSDETKASKLTIGYDQMTGNATATESLNFLNKLNAAYVKSIDEFIQRFNAKEFHPGINVANNDKLRLRSLGSLFDFQKFNREDRGDLNQILTFADTICANDIYLGLEDGGIYAEAQCLFDYNGREIPINLVLVFENIRDNLYKWSISGAHGLMELGMIDTSRNGYLNPVQHEMHFSELSGACNKDLTSYVFWDREIDQLSFFLGMQKSGQLKYVECNKIRFHFLQVPGYIFVVEKANRVDFNSGYLISEIIKCKDTEKPNYLKQILGV